MNTPNIETRLKNALAASIAPHSIVDDVMHQLPVSILQPTPRSGWRRPVIAASLAAPTVIIAALVFFFIGSAARLTLADVKAAVEQQAWVHIRYDVGPFKERWINLRTDETYATLTGGDVVYVNMQANTRHWYWKNNVVITQDSPVLYPPGKTPPPWTPKTAWEQIVAPLEQGVAKTKRDKSSPPAFISSQDSLDGKPLIRFDRYRTDSFGRRYLHTQLWADPGTHLPVLVKTHLQLSQRKATGKEWSTGEYDFPATGPADIYALGVPRDTPVDIKVNTAPAQPVLKAINRAHDGFLKNYRAIIWTESGGSDKPFDGLDVIWREGQKLRQDHHLPAFELQENNAPPLPQPDPAALLAWATQTEASVKQLMDSQREYVWRSAAVAQDSEPHVHVIAHDRFPLLDQNVWPERIQWPTRYYGDNFRLLDANVNTPDGCIGLRSGGVGNSRSDYYVDPKNDYVCVKQIQWTKRGTEWSKNREYTLSDLHRVAGRVVAGSQQFYGFPDPAKGLSGSKSTLFIDVVPLNATDYPPGIYDPATITTDAKVESD
ncbi:hypothetical protein V6x_13810 [Gimesia chilikensis]|uniref:Uncharacterized protein n=1 Tax=Gimesia chilikensis TaxID=2605989 RepID=A0A517W8W3_9PLAN|nr:hypothetical protein [Gimesia chilikensis]QDU01699.1 hypothetical protein V6x_13810 [Gimesia chilikensis]